MTATALASVTWGVLALGAVYPWAYWPLVWGALISGLLGLHRGPGLWPTLGHPLLLAVLAVCAAVAIQLIPLSPSILRSASPATLSFVHDYVRVPDEVVAAAIDGPVAAKPATAATPLSLRPRRTAIALVFVLALGVMIAGGAAGLGVTEARRLAAGVLILAAIVAFISIVQRATPNGRIYWLWEPRFQNTAWGPFVNRNHFAGWMVMAISAGLGYFVAVSSRAMRGIKGWRSRVVWLSSSEATSVVLGGLALALMGFSLVRTASRSGLICFVASMLVVSFALVNSRAHSGTRRRRMALVGYIVCLALATVVWTGLPLIANRFTYSDTATPFSLGGRAALWSTAIEIARRFPLTGTGLNTYTHVTPFFQRTTTPNSDEVHNDYLQLAAEGGLLVGIPVVVFVMLFVREVRLRFRTGNHNLISYWLRVGAVAGLVAIAVQESVEFSLQLPGNGVMFAMLCAIAVHNPEET